MKVVRTVVASVPGLGRRIKTAREVDGRSLKAICQEVGMSPVNWYRLESERQSLPEATLRSIERVLGVDFGVSFESDRHE